MRDREDTPAEVARARIWAIFEAVVSLHKRTGGDPAEAVYELLTTAILVSITQRPMKPPAELIADIAPLAEVTAREWFADEIAKVKHADH